MEKKLILIVEDEKDLAEVLAYNLQNRGYRTMLAHDGVAGLAEIRRAKPDLVILDLMLPGMTGMEVARQARMAQVTARIPILMLTAKGEETDIVAGLGVGADDYVTKPYSIKVVLARVAALLRRAVAPESAAQVSIGPLAADLSLHTITLDGVELKLTLTEFRLLVALMQSPRRVLARNDLISRVMGPGVVITSRTIDVHIAAIRKKLNQYGDMIRTVRGVGYQLTPLIRLDEAHHRSLNGGEGASRSPGALAAEE